eukprot:5929403-Pyramimonas_sp.AAC.1
MPICSQIAHGNSRSTPTGHLSKSGAGPRTQRSKGKRGAKENNDRAKKPAQSPGPGPLVAL